MIVLVNVKKSHVFPISTEALWAVHTSVGHAGLRAGAVL